ncbi:hypothetical protein LCI18_006851 [Fusarium solani-melongenae]|uniref:Uncharacterized protein n=1 Tax=Fusarium solani subsp. cucurbitae TaxID=2747967 RepID=A0ACD3Z4Z5_FUSSC|nr:hypothetical protein LCI18_006851 [Fusarium solani-melongenae]
MSQEIPARMRCRWVYAWLSITTATSVILVLCSACNIYLPEYFNKAIILKRAGVQAVIQCATFFLAFLQTTIIGGLVDKWTLHRLRKKPRTHDWLRFWASICKGDVDNKGSWRHIGLSLLWVAVLSTLQVWWTGALTPEPSLREISRRIEIPYFSEDPDRKDWNRTLNADREDIIRAAEGSFSYSPIYTILGSILDAAAAATAADNATQITPKLDNTRYQYVNRSYGVGASVGFDRDIENQTRRGLEKYHFVEPGYRANISCSYDQKMEASVREVDGGSYGSWYLIKQSLPHGSEEVIFMPGRRGDSEIVALLGNPHGDRYGWGIVVGESANTYEALNLTFCEVLFELRNFRIEVSPDQREIHVTVLDPPPPEDEGLLGKDWSQLRANVVRQIGMVVQTSGSALFSPLGHALVSNIAQAKAAQKNKLLPESWDDPEVSLYGITRALEAMVDHILMGFSGAQFMIAAPSRGRSTTSMTASYQVFKIGGKVFIWTVFATNIVILVLVATAEFLTKNRDEFDWCGPNEEFILTRVRNRRPSPVQHVWTGLPVYPEALDSTAQQSRGLGLERLDWHQESDQNLIRR